tara:strand:- start:1093 stop:1317 length:225 start_codon:yes stop_codon:yes gene_type:complete
MTNQHIALIAATILASTDEERRLKLAGRVTADEHIAAWEALIELSRNLCDVFKRVSPGFDRDAFMTACGFDAGV